MVAHDMAMSNHDDHSFDPLQPHHHFAIEDIRVTTPSEMCDPRWLAEAYLRLPRSTRLALDMARYGPLQRVVEFEITTETMTTSRETIIFVPGATIEVPPALWRRAVQMHCVIRLQLLRAGMPFRDHRHLLVDESGRRLTVRSVHEQWRNALYGGPPSTVSAG